MAFLREDSSSTEGTIALIQSRNFWVNAVAFLIFVLKIAGVSTGTIDVNGLIDALLNLSIGLSFFISMYTRYIATKKVTGIFKAAPIRGQSAMLSEDKP